MSGNIYTPRVCIDMLLGMPEQRNKSVCTKIPYKGYEISLSMDSSHGTGDLFRSDILVFDAGGDNVTRAIYPDVSYPDGTACTVHGDAVSLIEAFRRIDELTKCQTPS